MRPLLVRNLWSCRLETSFKQHISTVIKERIGNIIRTRYLAYDAHTYTMCMKTARDLCHLLRSWLPDEIQRLVFVPHPPAGPALIQKMPVVLGTMRLDRMPALVTTLMRQEKKSLDWKKVISFRYNQPCDVVKHYQSYSYICCLSRKVRFSPPAPLWSALDVFHSVNTMYSTV